MNIGWRRETSYKATYHYSGPLVGDNPSAAIRPATARTV